MKNIDKINKVLEWQNSEIVHPLTCSNCTSNLIPAVSLDNVVVLICVNCDYIQTYIPDVVLYKNIKDLKMNGE